MKLALIATTLTTLTSLFSPSGALVGAFPILKISKRDEPMICNGHASLCQKKYNEVVYIGAHNSYAVGNTLSDNQNNNVTKQLEDGIRLLQLQGHPFGEAVEDNPSGISLCHTSCYLQDGGYLENYLAQVKSWLDTNPNEVLTLLPTNPEHLNVTTWSKAFVKTGLDELAFVPTSYPVESPNWPTLSSLITSKKRLIVFMDYSSNTTEVPYILPEFSEIFENHYDQTVLPYNCSVDRGAYRYKRKMFLQNEAFDYTVLGISIPDEETAESTTNRANGTNGIIDTVERCASEVGVRATFVLTDYYDVPEMGGVFEAAAKLNNVSVTSDETSGSLSATMTRGNILGTFYLACSLILCTSLLTLL